MPGLHNSRTIFTSMKSPPPALSFIRTNGSLSVTTPNEHRLLARNTTKNSRKLERIYKPLKRDLRIRPIYHYKDLRVRGHVFICVLAYLLEKFMDKKLKQAHLSVSHEKALQKLKNIRLVKYAVMNRLLQKSTDISNEQEDIFNALGVSNIPRIPIY